MASQSLAIAQAKGAANAQVAMDRVEAYTAQTARAFTPPAVVIAGSSAGGVGSGSGGGIGPSSGGGVGSGKSGGIGSGSTAMTVEVSAASAGVPLYKKAQELEQLSRTENDREKNAKQIQEITGQLSDSKFVTGFGSIGGEEFFSYLNISESLRRTGGPEWKKWQAEMTAKLLKMQNEDGTWAGHHCITGRVAVTSAAILLLTAERERAPMVQTSVTKH